MSRISREGMLLSVLVAVKDRSSCERAQVGALIVRDARIVSMGYNGSPPRTSHCLDVGCDLSMGEEAGCQRAIHAELNAIAWAAQQGIATDGATMYCTHSPCRACAQAIVSAGITKFIYLKPYRLGRTDILQEALVEVRQIAEASFA